MTVLRAEDRRGAGIEIYCVGNPERGDDAIGPIVADRLVGRFAQGVTITLGVGEVFTQIDRWTSRRALICIDAAQNLGSPGRIYRFDFAQGLPADLHPATSSHAFGLRETLELADILERLPDEVIVFAIEAENFEPGARMSPAMVTSLPHLLDAVVDEVERLSRNPQDLDDVRPSA